jgi:Glycosyl transferases group 1
MAFEAVNYEAEDVFMEADHVDLFPLEPGAGFRFKEKCQRRLLWKDVTRVLASVNPGLRTVRLRKEYDLFFCRFQTLRDLLYVNAVQGWKDRCRVSVCWLDELYAADAVHSRNYLHILKRFDHVFVGFKGSVDAISKVIGRRCHFLPPGVDAVRFSPYPNPPARVIDIYSLGRRLEGLHRTLLKFTADRSMFYVYETLQTGAENLVSNHRQHRQLLANQIKRSRYFLVAPGKANLPEETRGQIEVPARFYEGAAAGTVMIGQAPDCEPFRQLFGWKDAVIAIDPNSFEVADVLAELAGQPERLWETSRRNAVEALLRHDWSYRWKQILAIAGLRPTPQLELREKRLKELADVARNYPLM